jgi:hypothetical protein
MLSAGTTYNRRFVDRQLLFTSHSPPPVLVNGLAEHLPLLIIEGFSGILTRTECDLKVQAVKDDAAIVLLPAGSKMLLS